MKLLETGYIGGIEISNRLIKAATTTNLANTDGSVSERLVRHYQESARGGSGIIIVESAHIDNIASRGSPCQLSLCSDEYIPGLSWLADTIKENGAKAAIQLNHCGRQNFLCLGKIKSASNVTLPYLYDKYGSKAIPHALTIEEIKAIVEAFGQAAERAKQAGFDLLEIQGANGFLITNFLSPHTNKRTDIYGESLQNRLRMAVEVYQRVRTALGKDFPILFRLNGTDYEPDGFALEDSIELCRILEKEGVDAIHISGGDYEKIIHLFSPMYLPAAHNIWAAEAVKKAVKIPLIASGSINTPDLAEDILLSEKADFIALARPLLADAEWINKLKQGRKQDIRPCLRCNDGCLHKSLLGFHPISCAVNPLLGSEGKIKPEAAVIQKKIAIVGGGPAGLQAAIISAERAHTVTLFEKNKLGGALNEASIPWFKQDLKLYLDYLIFQVQKKGIKIITQEADYDLIKIGGYDIVFLALGSCPANIILSDGKKITVKSIKEVLQNGAKGEKQIAILGGGKNAVELALWLDDQNMDVVLTEFHNEILKNCPITDQIALQEKLSDSNIKILTNIQLKLLNHYLVSLESNREKIEVTSSALVSASEGKPNREFAQKLKDIKDLVILEIGDCIKSGGIYEAVHSAFNAAYFL